MTKIQNLKQIRLGHLELVLGICLGFVISGQKELFEFGYFELKKW